MKTRKLTKKRHLEIQEKLKDISEFAEELLHEIWGIERKTRKVSPRWIRTDECFDAIRRLQETMLCNFFQEHTKAYWERLNIETVSDISNDCYNLHQQIPK